MINLTQDELRKFYCERLEREKQCYIAQQVGINAAVLSRFRHEKIDLYPHLFAKLEAYLLNQN